MRPLSALPPVALVALAAAQVQSLPAVLPSVPLPLEYYLPTGGAYDASFPRPESVLGWTVGEWHVRHDQLLEWCRTVAQASPRVALETYGKTHEDRPLLLATITSPANHERLEELRRAHLEAVLAGAPEHAGPEVVWLGYGVHGNEPSASNAALVVLYHLAAATGPEIEARSWPTRSSCSIRASTPTDTAASRSGPIRTAASTSSPTPRTVSTERSGQAGARTTIGSI